MPYLKQIRENYNRVGHLTEVRGIYDSRYHVSEEEVLDFQSEVRELEALIRAYDESGSPLSLKQVNTRYEAFEAKWSKNRTSL